MVRILNHNNFLKLIKIPQEIIKFKRDYKCKYFIQNINFQKKSSSFLKEFNRPKNK